MPVEPSTDATADVTADSILLTVVVFGIISIVVYLVLLKPLFVTTATTRQTNRNDTGSSSTNTDATQQQQQRRPTLASNDQPSWLRSTRNPPHVQGTALLVEGMVSFRTSTAASVVPDDVIRKERAKLLSRVLSLSSDSSNHKPPTRGTTLVVSVPAMDVECPQLRRILFLLGTYFTLVVVICVDDGPTEDAAVNLLSTKLLEKDEEQQLTRVLPLHRIVAAQSPTGRIALARQLGRSAEFILTQEASMRDELGRFGFKVLVYGEEVRSSSSGRSKLAMQLMDD